MTFIFCFISFCAGAWLGYKLGFGYCAEGFITCLKDEGWELELTEEGELKPHKMYADYWYERRNK